MRRNEKAALEFAPREAAHESSPRQPRSLEEPDTPRNSTAPRPVASLADARRRRAEALLRDEEIPDQEAERRVWGDRERAS
jgi:hypothetical protein